MYDIVGQRSEQPLTTRFIFETIDHKNFLHVTYCSKYASQIASVINNVQCMLQLAARHQHLLNAEWLHQTNSCFSFLDHLIHGRHNYCQKTPELSAWREDAVPVKWWYIFWLNFPLKILSIAPLTLCECK